MRIDLNINSHTMTAPTSPNHIHSSPLDTRTSTHHPLSPILSQSPSPSSTADTSSVYLVVYTPLLLYHYPLNNTAARAQGGTYWQIPLVSPHQTQLHLSAITLHNSEQWEGEHPIMTGAKQYTPPLAYLAGNLRVAGDSKCDK